MKVSKNNNKIRRIQRFLCKICMDHFGVRPLGSMHDEAKIISYICNGYSQLSAEKVVFKEK